MSKLTCNDCVYRWGERCMVDPPIVVLTIDGTYAQTDPNVHTDRIACKWHMTGDERSSADTIRMA